MATAIDNKITGRLALFIGASGGIGAACARQRAAEGVRLPLIYSSNKKAIDDLVESICENPASSSLRTSVHRVDLASIEETPALYPQVSVTYGGQVIDILVSNAGYGVRIKNVWEIPLSVFEYTVNVNLQASFLLAQGLVEAMGGRGRVA